VTWSEEGTHAIDDGLGGGSKAQTAEKRDPFRNGGSEQAAWCLQKTWFVISVHGQILTVLFAATSEKRETRRSGKL
jgi:hypothetical protein